MKKNIEKVTDQDIRKALKIMDRLLEDLPKMDIDKFAKSEDFELYKKVLIKFVPEAEHEENLKKKFTERKLEGHHVKKIHVELKKKIKKHKDKHGIIG